MKLKGYFVEDIPRRKFLELSLKGGLAIAATPALLRSLLAGDTAAQPTVDLQDLNWVIRQALNKGGEFGEVYVEHRISRSILLEEGSSKALSSGSAKAPAYAYSQETKPATPIRMRSPRISSSGPPRWPPLWPGERKP